MRLCCIILAVALPASWPHLSSAQELLTFSEVHVLANQEVTVRVASSNGAFYRLEVTTNLLDWQGWITALGTGSETYTDSQSPYLSSRFYRAVQLAGNGHLTGDHLPTEDGEVIFHPVDHASFVMKWNDLTIYNDPVGGSSPYTGLPSANLILVSHFHGDHFHNDTLSAVRAAGAKIIVPPDVYNRLTNTLREQAISLPNGSVTNVMNVTVEGVPAYNSRHTKGISNGYVLTLGGKRVYTSADTEDVAEMRALQNIDVAFLCMNIPFTMTVQQAADAVRTFQPRVVYPYHYQNQNGTYSDLALFKQLVGADQGVEVRMRDWY